MATKKKAKKAKASRLATSKKGAKPTAKKAQSKSKALVHQPKKVGGGEVLPPAHNEKQLEALAREHDHKLTSAIKSMKEAVVEVGEELAFMQNGELKLWRHVKDPNTDGSNRGCFGTWRDYAKSRLGDMSKSAMYEYIAAHSLTQGEAPIPKADVQKIGVKKAAEVAKLPASERKAAVEHAKKAKVSEVKKRTSAKIEGAKPENERKVKLFPFSRSLPEATIKLIEEIEKSGMFMEGIRDGDRTESLRAKLWNSVWVNFQASFAEELREGEQYREQFMQKLAKKKGSEVSEEELIAAQEKTAGPKNSNQEDTEFPSAEAAQGAFQENSAGDD
jgi:hypothetical protein